MHLQRVHMLVATVSTPSISYSTMIHSLTARCVCPSAPQQTAFAEPARAQWLHKARLLCDTAHDLAKATTDAEGVRPGKKKCKIAAAAPAYLKRRLRRGEEMPKVKLCVGVSGEKEGRSNGADEKDEENVILAVLKHVIGGEEGGGLLKDLYYDLMDMLAMRWDDQR